MRREIVTFWQFHLFKVAEDEVPALGVRVRQAELVKDLAEAGDLGLHLALALIPEALLVRSFEADGRGLLQRAHAAVADARVRDGDVPDQVLGPNQPPDAPARGVEVLARRADGQGQPGDVRRQRGDAGEGDVVEAVVDLVGEDDDVVFDAQRADGLEFVLGKDLAERVVRGVEHDHARPVADAPFQFGKVERPFGRGGRLGRAFLWRLEGRVDHLPARHLDVGDISARGPSAPEEKHRRR